MSDQPSRETDDRNLTWGVIEAQDQAVFAPTRQVEDLRQLRRALAESATWGDFRSQAPSQYVAEVHELVEEQPSDDDGFDPKVIPGYADADWPEWLQQEMLSWMPDDLTERFGKVGESVFKESALEIEAGVAEDLAGELEKRGFSCTRDDKAILTAAGWE